MQAAMVFGWIYTSKAIKGLSLISGWWNRYLMCLAINDEQLEGESNIV